MQTVSIESCWRPKRESQSPIIRQLFTQTNQWDMRVRHESELKKCYDWALETDIFFEIPLQLIKQLSAKKWWRRVITGWTSISFLKKGSSQEESKSERRTNTRPEYKLEYKLSKYSTGSSYQTVWVASLRHYYYLCCISCHVIHY